MTCYFNEKKTKMVWHLMKLISGAGRRALSVVLCVFASFQCLDLAETGKSYIVHLCDKIEVTEDMALGHWRTRQNSGSTLPGLFLLLERWIDFNSRLTPPFFCCCFLYLYGNVTNITYILTSFLFWKLSNLEKNWTNNTNIQRNHGDSRIIRLPYFLLYRFSL